MLESSADLVNIAKAFAFLWVGVLFIFFTFTAFYMVLIIRDARGIIKDFRDKIKLVDTILKTIKDKLEHSSVALTFLVDAVRDILKFVQVTKEKRSTKRKSIRKKNDDE